MDRLAAIAGPVMFVCAIAAHFLLGVNALVRVLGVGCIFGGVHALVTRKVPVGWEGQPPSTHLKGSAAVIFGLLLLGVGLGMVFFAGAASCMLGWAPEC